MLLLGFALGVIWLAGFAATAMAMSDWGFQPTHLTVVGCCLWPLSLPLILSYRRLAR